MLFLKSLTRSPYLKGLWIAYKNHDYSLSVKKYIILLVRSETDKNLVLF